MINRMWACTVKFTCCWLSLFLIGCSPEYNWRETQAAQSRIVIAFPSRVQTESREIVIEGQKSLFTMAVASVGPAVFAVGDVSIPEGLSVAQTNALTQSFVESLANNYGQKAPERTEPDNWFRLEAQIAGQPSVMWAKVFVHRGVLVQIVVSGPKSKLPQEQAMQFMHSLVLK